MSKSNKPGKRSNVT